MKPRFHDWILAYTGWITLFLLSLWLVFRLQQNIVEDLFFMRVNPWQLRGIGQWAVYVLGAVWLIYVFLCEGYLRQGLLQGILYQRLVKVGAPVLILLALSWIVSVVL